MIGRILGHYKLIEQVGAGGMGVVYRARDERLERDVALKVLSTGALGTNQARSQLRKEALALAQLNHAHIGAVYDFDTQDGLDFLVMEFVAGTTLADRLPQTKLPEREVLTLAAQIAHALEEAHEHDAILNRPPVTPRAFSPHLSPELERIASSVWRRIRTTGISRHGKWRLTWNRLKNPGAYTPGPRDHRVETRRSPCRDHRCPRPRWCARAQRWRMERPRLRRRDATAHRIARRAAASRICPGTSNTSPFADGMTDVLITELSTHQRLEGDLADVSHALQGRRQILHADRQRAGRGRHHRRIGSARRRSGGDRRNRSRDHAIRADTRVITGPLRKRRWAGRSAQGEAQAILTELRTRSRQTYVSAFYLALVYAGLGMRDQAMEQLEKAVEERQPYLAGLNVEPPFLGLHDDPEIPGDRAAHGIPTAR